MAIVGITPNPAPGTTPAASTTAPPGATTPAAPAAPTAPVAPAHTHNRWERVASMSSMVLVIIGMAIGAVIGMATWDHKRVAWVIAWAILVGVFVGVVILIVDAVQVHEVVVAPAAPTPTPPSTPTPAPTAPTPPSACAMHVDVWTDCNGTQFLLDSAGVMWRNDSGKAVPV